MRLRDDDGDWDVTVEGDAARLSTSGDTFAIADAGDGRWNVSRTGSAGAIDGVAARAGDVVWVSVEGELFAFHIETASGGSRSPTRAQDALTPPMSATVVRVAVKPGDAVNQADVVVVLEAMKMELAIRAPESGTVKAVHCKVGDMVHPGLVLVDIE